MKKISACMIGVGSIAMRHVKNLHKVCSQRGLDLTIDAFRHRPSAEIEGIRHVFSDENEMPDDYDAIFITNPTEMHLLSLIRFHGKGRNYFIEKPVVSLGQLEKASQLIRKEDAVYYVACPLRYNRVISHIRENIVPEDVIGVRSISSSYLPDWRPGKDYRETYSAQKVLGGGVSIDLIHEWDYLTYLFGFPQKVQCLIGKKSPLEIDSDDFAIYIAEMDGMTVELHLDYYGRKTMREIQLFTKDDTIVGNLSENRISYLVSGKEIDFHEERDDYQRRELDHFLDMITGKAPKEDGFLHGLRVLDLTQGKI